MYTVRFLERISRSSHGFDLLMELQSLVKSPSDHTEYQFIYISRKQRERGEGEERARGERQKIRGEKRRETRRERRWERREKREKIEEKEEQKER